MSTREGSLLRFVRPALASSGCLAAAGAWSVAFGDEAAVFLHLPTAALVAAAYLCHAPAPGAQMLARGVMWAMLVLGAMIAQLGEGAAATAVAVGCGVSLLVLGGRGLDGESARFRPVAYRGTLTAALTLAMADTFSLGFWALAAQEASVSAAAAALAGCALLMGIGIVGLYRLKTWGLGVNIGANLLIAGLAGSGAIDTPPFLTCLLVGTATLQLLVPIPLLYGILRKRPPSSSGGAARTGRVLAVGAILLVLGAALQPLVGHPMLAML
jgi:hypothetical protein